MGGANNICSDKTGTLTRNEMDVNKIWNVTTKTVDMNKNNLNLDDFIP